MNANQIKFPKKKSELGAIAVEYMVLIVFIGLSLALASSMLGNSISGKLKNIADYISSGISGDDSHPGGINPGEGTSPPPSGSVDLISPNLTNNNVPTISGTATPDSTITIYDNDKSIGTTVAGSDGGWEFTPEIPLTDGEHNISAIGTDTDGTSFNLTNNQTVTIDTVAPSRPEIGSVSTTFGLVSNGGFSLAHQVTFSGTAESNAQITIKDASSGRMIGEATVLASGGWTFSSNYLVNGLYIFAITTTDAAGNVSAPTSFIFNVLAP